MGVFNEMSIVLILSPMYRGNLFDFLQFDDADEYSIWKCTENCWWWDNSGERVLEWTAEGELKAQASRGDVGCTLQQIMYVGT